MREQCVVLLKEREMYQLMSTLSPRDLLVRQFPSFSLAFLIASLFYRFGSFALETVAFLATWFVLDAASGLVLSLVTGRGSVSASVHSTGKSPPHTDARFGG